MTREQAEEIAQDAAKQRGQDWNALPQHSRDIWIEAARNNEPWLQQQEQPEEAEPVDDEPDDNGVENGPKPKAKRGKK